MKTRWINMIAVTLIGSALMLTGCSSDSGDSDDGPDANVIGAWDFGSADFRGWMTFNADGTIVGRDDATGNGNGTYSVSGNTVTAVYFSGSGQRNSGVMTVSDDENTMEGVWSGEDGSGRLLFIRRR